MPQNKRVKKTGKGLAQLLIRNGIEPTMNSALDVEAAKKLKFNGNGAKFEYVGNKK